MSIAAWEDISGLHFEGEEANAIWDQFVTRFAFRPGVTSMPVVDEPTPSITYFIGHIYGPRERYLALIADLNTKMLAAFRTCVPLDGWLYALDWHHPTYRFRPHAPFNIADENAWRVPVLPNGDYYIFLAPDLRFGAIGHPWEQTMCIYGAELLTAMDSGQPHLFDIVLRESGQQLRPLVRGHFDVADGRPGATCAIGPPGMHVAEFVKQLEASGYEFPGGHGTLIKVLVTEDIAQ